MGDSIIDNLSDEQINKIVKMQNDKKKNKKHKTVSKYSVLAEALGQTVSNVSNYIKGVNAASQSVLCKKINKASDIYDKEIELFKAKVKEKIKIEVEKIE